MKNLLIPMTPFNEKELKSLLDLQTILEPVASFPPSEAIMPCIQQAVDSSRQACLNASLCFRRSVAKATHLTSGKRRRWRNDVPARRRRSSSIRPASPPPAALSSRCPASVPRAAGAARPPISHGPASLQNPHRHGMVACHAREIQAAGGCACREATLSRPSRTPARAVLQRRTRRLERL